MLLNLHNNSTILENLFTYFPNLNSKQKEQFLSLPDLYKDWNSKINVISRKDIDNFEERHLLHSLSIAKIISFKPGTKIMDVGTGGGFPGIPLAILFPESKFLLVDSVGKKIKVVNEIIKTIDLKNVKATNTRAEKITDHFDFAISRAVTTLPEFYVWIKGKIIKKGFNNIPNGVLYLKGGDFQEELIQTGKSHKLYPISQFFKEEFFETKYVVHLY